MPAHDGRRVPPFGNPRIKALLAAPRGLSQPQTSFIGTVCQGIHHTPLQHTHQYTRTGPARFLIANSQTTNHHTKMITKRSTNNNKQNIQMRVRSKSTAKQRFQKLLLLASTIQFSNHHAPHAHRTPTKGPAPRMGIEPRHGKTLGWRSGSPKASHTIPTQDDRQAARSLPHQHPDTASTIAPAGHTLSENTDCNLRRKEVIQPHLPVRLPCYDLVPITSLTLDGSPTKGLGHRLRVLPTFMT